MNILIIEDDAVASKVYSNMFARADFIVHTATDGAQALPLVISANPDVILLDLLLPDMSGVDLLTTLRLALGYKNPVIAYTHMYTPQIVADAYSAGAQEVFDKAMLSPGILLDTVRNLHKQQRAKAA